MFCYYCLCSSSDCAGVHMALCSFLNLDRNLATCVLHLLAYHVVEIPFVKADDGSIVHIVS